MPKILVVDDEPTTVFTLKKLLEKENYEIIEALSGEEALELTEKGKELF